MFRAVMGIREYATERASCYPATTGNLPACDDGTCLKQGHAKERASCLRANRVTASLRRGEPA